MCSPSSAAPRIAISADTRYLAYGTEDLAHQSGNAKEHGRAGFGFNFDSLGIIEWERDSTHQVHPDPDAKWHSLGVERNET